MSIVTYASDPPHVWALHAQASGKLAFDIGANGGMTTALYAETFEKVIAFEPCKESYEHLSLRRIPNVRAVCQAVSDEVGHIELDERSVTGRLGELTTGNPLLAKSWGEKTGRRVVTSTTLDAAAAYYGQPDFIKIDTEGHEARIVQGGDVIWEACPALLIEVHEFGNLQPILDKLQPCYRTLALHLHDGYGRDDPIRSHHFYLSAGFS